MNITKTALEGKLATASKLLLELENAQAQLNQTDKLIQVMIEQQFPEYEVMKQTLSSLKQEYANAVYELKTQAVTDNDDLTSKTSRGAIVLKYIPSVTYWDEKEAIRFARANSRFDLLKLSVLKSVWQKSINNGEVFPTEIIQVEDVLTAALSEENLKSFAMVSTPNDVDNSDQIDVEGLPF